MKTQRLHLIKPISDTIPEYFSGKNIFLTGFTGYLGKYFVQKLLTDCTDIGRIYVLIRESRNKTIKEKLDDALANPIFDHLREKNPSIFDAIIPIKGDIKEINMGISEKSRQEIVSNVSLIYHVAASIRFDMPLRDAILLNVRATREVCNLAMDLKKCEVFMHVSTAYSQNSSKVIEEKLYPAPVSWKEAIELAENADNFTLKIISEKYIQGYPNTYTFTKALAESLVKDMCSSGIPTIIIRPTIVSPAYGGPIPGWADNLYGPMGLSLAMAKGVLRTFYGHEKTSFDFISVDFLINSMIKATWIQQYLSPAEISVYNCSSYSTGTVPLKELLTHGAGSKEALPLNAVWHVDFETITYSKMVYFMNIFLFHLIPGFFIDFVLGIIGKPQIFVKLQRKVYVSLLAVEYFLQNQWEFINYKCEEIDDYVQESDKKIFYEMVKFDLSLTLKQSSLYAMKHILKEGASEEDLVSNRRKQKIMAVIHLSVKYTTAYLILEWAWNNVITSSFNMMLWYWDSL